MEQKNNTLALQVQEKALDTLTLLQNAIKESHISSFEIKNDGNTTTVIIDSIDKKERIINTKYTTNGYSIDTTIKSNKETALDRKETVKKLFKAGNTQAEICKITMVSQKTVSNDIKKLRDEKLIK